MRLILVKICNEVQRFVYDLTKKNESKIYDYHVRSDVVTITSLIYKKPDYLKVHFPILRVPLL